jgi:hypothetical protein
MYLKFAKHCVQKKSKLNSQIQEIIIYFDVNTAIWLAGLLGETLVIQDNLGWYCDVTNVFILHRHIQIFPWNNRDQNLRKIKFCCKNVIFMNIWNFWTGYTCIIWVRNDYAF